MTTALPYRLLSRSSAALALTFALALAPSIADAREAKSAAAGTLELELRTLEGKKTVETRAFLLPIHGELAGTVELFEQTHWCRLQAHESHDQQIRLEIDCYQGGRKREDQSFEFAVERSFEPGTALTLGELATHGDQRLQIVATRR